MDNVKTKEKTLLTVSWITAIGGGVLMLLSLILTFISMEERSYSMIGYVQELKKYSKEIRDGDALFAVITAIVVLIGIFSFFALLFSLLKKPVPTIVFTVLAGVMFYILCWDFTSRGVVSERFFSWSTAYYVFIAGAVISFAAAVCMVIMKIRLKRQTK